MTSQHAAVEATVHFAQQLHGNFESLKVPEELRDSPGAYRFVLLYTLAQYLQQELSQEAAVPASWLAEGKSQTDERIAERWEMRCYATEILMRSVCTTLEGVCTGEFLADYIKAKALVGLQSLGLCNGVELLLTEKEQHLLKR